MATVVLQTVGAAVGGALGGPVGAMLGRAAGALAGAYADQQIFGPGDRTVQGPRLDSTQALSSREGAPIARVYGRARVAGEIIWATRFVEVQSTEETGGKGGGGGSTTVESYAYYGNFAIGLCEGPIGGIGRIWADGKLLEQTLYTIRSYTGTPWQQPDSLIEAKQGAGNAPAFRNLAYLVFDNLPLEKFGNRIPQIAVEILRPTGRLEKLVSGVNMIPGATEFGYDTERVTEDLGNGTTRPLNVHQTTNWTDFGASLAELVATCPNLRQIALVVAWFGNDLRASHCQLRPGVEVRQRVLEDGEPWQVAGFNRSNAHLVSTINGNPAYGGTPSDASVLRAIQLIKAYGLKVCINPFIMIDVPPTSHLPDPEGATSQPPYPWRGRITCHPAPGQPGSPDRSAFAGQQVAQFTGTVPASAVTLAQGQISHAGVNEHSYRRLILHYARLAELAGGVDMFMIGSEMRGLTKVRSSADTFPFVGELVSLSHDVKAILGQSCFVTYGADWSEYFGYHPQDGSGDVFFNLDPLWASVSIDGVGIDNYMPLSDWRDDDRDDLTARAANDPDYLKANMAAGEGFDWYYPSLSHRYAKQRSAITDGQGKPWVFRYKDLKNWWSNYHFERRGHGEVSYPTAWQPGSKPFVFTEYGCPAVHNGPGQPNVFYDPKSSESFFPYHSLGYRDDQAQFAYLEAHQSHWDARHPQFVQANNPWSVSYGGRMVDMERSQLWAWDARPYPAFPVRSDLWSDAANWYQGHWLNGRLGAVRLADLIHDIIAEVGITQVDTSQVYGVFDGYLLGDVASPRSALEVLVNLYRLDVFERQGTLVFRSRGRDAVIHIPRDHMVFEQEEPVLAVERAQESDIPAQVRLNHMDPGTDFQATQSQAQRINGGNLDIQSFNAPIIAHEHRMAPVVEQWLSERWTNRETVQFALDRSYLHLKVGDVLTLEVLDHAGPFRITSIEEGRHLTITATVTAAATPAPSQQVLEEPRAIPALLSGKATVAFLDLPLLPGSDGEHGNRVALTQVPRGGPHDIFASPSSSGFAFRQRVNAAATQGLLTSQLPPTHVVSRWQPHGQVQIKVTMGNLSSAAEELVLAGNNALAVEKSDGEFEVLQFKHASLIAPQEYRLEGLLRGQAGTEKEAALPAAAGARVVLINKAVAPLEIELGELGRVLNWRVAPIGRALNDPQTASAQFAPGLRGERPYSPVHLRAHRASSGSVHISWTRRDRKNSDSWSLAEVPMSEAQERYRVELTKAGSEPLVLEVLEPHAQLSQSALQNHFGVLPTSLDIAVSQVSAAVGPGPAATITFNP
ncbi:MAG: glycoside hydrolase TIM-barrel-like domain-containing protein [Pseudomonadota bacterium]